MKKSLKFLAVLFVSLMANTNGFSSDPLTAVRVKSMGVSSFGIYLENLNSKRIKISLKDTTGFVLYTKNIKREGAFSKAYNLRNLPMGRYLLNVEDELSLKSYTIELSNNNLAIEDSNNLLKSTKNKISEFEPFMRQRGDILDLMVFSPEQAKHEIRVYNQQNKIIFSEVEDKKLKIEKQYNFSMLESGVYEFVVLSAGQKYNYRILKN